MATLRLNPAKMQLIAGFVDTYLRLEPEEEAWVREEIEKFDPQTRKKAMQIVTTWEQQGRELGRKEGLQQGLQKEALALALRLLKRRFTKLSRVTERRIAALSLSQLEDLCEASLDFQDAKQLQEWFARQEALKN